MPTCDSLHDEADSKNVESCAARRLAHRRAAAIRVLSSAAIALALAFSLASRSDAQEAPSVIAQFTTAVEDHEPVDQVTFVENDVRKVFFFSDLRGLAGRTVVHRWIHDGNTVAEVRFEIGGPRWRVWSSKELMPDWIGDWTVEIVTSEGEVLGAETFTYKPPDA